ncbi:MAG: NADH-quinone oxidoreductase subunit C [Planctomycetota bacterium]
MDREQLIESVKTDLADRLIDVFERNPARCYVTCEPDQSIPVNQWMIEHGGRLATATGVDCRDWVEMCYHYCFDALKNLVVTVKTRGYKPACEIPSLGAHLPGAMFIEREMQDLLGATFVGHPDPRRLILADDWPEGVYPLRKDYCHEANANTGRALSPDPGRARVLSTVRRG